MGALGLSIVVVFVLVAIFAPWIAPYDPIRMNYDELLKSPNPSNWLGTDEYGRDLASRLIWGARTSLIIGLSAVFLGTTSGAILGMVGGFLGGRFDLIIQRVMDMLMAFPMLVLALAMVAVLGASVQNVIFALSVAILPNAARILRSATLVIREQAFVEAALNLGFSKWRILFRHILPNCVGPYVVVATSVLGTAILSEATLSFLGLGTPPPAPSWGAMLSGKTQSYMVEAPWLAIFPGLTITLVVFAFNFFGDALRDLIDPKSTK